MEARTFFPELLAVQGISISASTAATGRLPEAKHYVCCMPQPIDT
jgi:hypothetical protein